MDKAYMQDIVAGLSQGTLGQMALRTDLRISDVMQEAVKGAIAIGLIYGLEHPEEGRELLGLIEAEGHVGILRESVEQMILGGK